MKKREREELLLHKKANKLLQDSEKDPSDKRILNELYATNLRLKKFFLKTVYQYIFTFASLFVFA